MLEIVRTLVEPPARVGSQFVMLLIPDGPVAHACNGSRSVMRADAGTVASAADQRRGLVLGELPDPREGDA